MQHTITYADNTSRTWPGFEPASRQPQQGDMLAIAWFDGDPDLWFVDGETGIQALRAYYAEDWEPDRVRFDTYTVRSSDVR